LDTAALLSEVTFKAVRSSGAGGQHVNKVSSKVVLFFNVAQSQALSDQEKDTLINNLGRKLTGRSILVLNCDETRSQIKNKELVIKRFLALIQEGLKTQKPRKVTKIPKAVKQKRLDDKRRQAQLKSSRKKPDID
jgi:ribosome-associated protein